MPPICVLLTLQCPLCRSRVVWVREEGAADRLICPVCWAVGERAENGLVMQRGTPVAAALKYQVDKVRFPRVTPGADEEKPAEATAAPPEPDKASPDGG